MSKTAKTLVIIAFVIVLGVIGLVTFHSNQSPIGPAPSGPLQVVAAENFWGSIVSQIGGSHVHVLSIVSDPNADPHEYESNTMNARAVAGANYIIENGAGYDSWMDKLLGASANPHRTVLNVATLLGKQDGDNPHFWYNPDYVNQASAQMERDLAAIDPANAAYYEAQYTTLQASLAEYQNRIASIKRQFSGTPVAATEDIFAYLAQAAGLNLISPPAFIQAVAEGNDPPAASVVEFENQLKSKSVKILVYNEQTVTPLTENIKALAADQNIPVVGVTETIQPPDASFEEWMNAQLLNIENALNAQALGQ
ncbi:MAG TPA: zinc ABC transporter substrate-binding protein [Candidatus Paceibacterota bacterium]|nr:zinc ABC transporter substrate-binding protein [Candidatus Paceibacterota bacterium]